MSPYRPAASFDRSAASASRATGIRLAMLGVVCVNALCLSTLPTPVWAQQSPPPPPPVRVEPVRVRETRASSRFLGTVRPKRSTTIGCAVAGRVSSLEVSRGDLVQAGDTVAQLQTTVVNIELDAAMAELRLFGQQLKELEAGSRAEDVAEAKAQMEAAAAVSKRAASQLNRVRRLVESRAASADEIDVATAEAESSKQFYEAAVIAHQRLVAGPRVEQVAQAQARYDLQQEQVRLLKDRLAKHTVLAPFEGFVTLEHTEAGAWITAGGPVIDLVELDEVEVEVAVPAAQVVSLRPGQSVRAECAERPSALLIGTVRRVVPVADTRARTYPVLVQFENPMEGQLPVLMSGMLVRVQLPTGPKTEATFVSTDSIVLNRTRQSVFVVDMEDDGEAGTVVGTVREVAVQLGVADGRWIAVQGDLKRGDPVVTRGNEQLTSGDKVTVSLPDS